MEQAASASRSARSQIKDRFLFIRENTKLIARFLLAVLFIAVGAWFLKHEQAETGEIKRILLTARLEYLGLGILVTLFYIVLQGFMYKMAFASIKSRVSLGLTTMLFLKRNLISIFMPAGGIASLAFFSEDIQKKGESRTKILFASSIYAFVGILTIIMVGIPVLLYTMFKGITGSGEVFALGAVILIVISLFVSFRSILKKKYLYKTIVKYLPSMEVFLGDLISHKIDINYLIITVLVSVLIDMTGIIHLYIAMLALGFKASLFYAMLGYLTAVISLSLSPFIRGLGAVEISMSFILVRLGYTNIEAIAITFLYRFFEFWLPLLSGALSFFLKINKILFRIFPALLIFTLGLINIISSITPAISERIHILEDLIPVNAIVASNYFVFIAGAFMLLTAVFMLRGSRNAWWIGLILSIVSCIGHLTKAIDYEEASIALIMVIILIFSRKEYNLKSNPRLHTVGIWSSVLSMTVVLIYGTIGFYFLDEKHFGADFNLWQSIIYSIKNFILIGSPDLVPGSHFAKYFLISMNINGLLTFSFLFYTIIRPYFLKVSPAPEELDNAKRLVEIYGSSALDYFKTYRDKMIFFTEKRDSFISYRTAGNYAVVLENPVAANQAAMEQCIILFDKFCYVNGLKNIFYRVPEETLQIYKSLSRKCLFLGQEGVVDLGLFTLEGGKNKALRNAINKVIDGGLKSSIHTPPIMDGLLQKLKTVSDEWLRSTRRNEIIFSQGMFDWNELKKQTIITVENPEGKVIAFLNIIPDYKQGEATYDLIRRTDDAPHGVLDFMLVELFRYLKSQNYLTVNLGFAPLGGITDPHTFQERSMKFAYERLKSFAHFKGLRNYKEKFFPVWYNKYLIYANDYDLLEIPAILAKVIQPNDD
ncbi:MAG TPA: phosphatidylglycerol lysyltransferase domain-containing protein [Bacteroidales bacterium]|jgi:phosphatidylglycerol lysyltransferase|nr:phosphatidylglycerol lysyltransferase domain-containing protein [Bacteroidales bacterium]HQJ81979.1 phosphatidylglycerol lysyltransferase domain-containing protein [Bacteroidales bacterium]